MGNIKKSLKLKLYSIPGMIVISFLIAAYLFISVINSNNEVLDVSEVKANEEREINLLLNQISNNHLEVFNLLNLSSNQRIDEETLYEKSSPIIDKVHFNHEELLQIQVSKSRDLNIQKLYKQVLDDYVSYKEAVLSAITMTTVDVKLASEKIVISNKHYHQISKGLDSLNLNVRVENQTFIINAKKETLSIKHVFMITLFISLVFVMLLTVRISHNVFSSILNLLKASRNIIMKSNYEVRAKADREDELGELAGVFNTMLDKIQGEHRKQLDLNKEIQVAFNENNSIIESLSQILVVFNSAGKILKINSSGLCILGVTKEEELKDFNIKDLYKNIEYENSDGDGLDNILQIMTDLNGERLDEVQAELFSITGESIPVLMTGKKIVNKNIDVETKYIITAKDVRDSLLLKKLQLNQEQMLNTSKLASLGSVTAGIAHEIKNPLNLILNSSDLVVEKLESKVIGKIDSNLDDQSITKINKAINTILKMAKIVSENSTRATQIINSMLDLARGKEDTLIKHNIVDLVNEQISFARHSLKVKHEIDITPSFKFDATRDVYIFPQEISRAILNILDNAFYSLKEKMDEDFSFSPELNISLKSNDSHFIILIHDNGKGVDEKKIKKIIEPFYTSKPAGKGTGLGLSMVHQIISELHKGEMNITSKVGEFCQFEIKIPFNLETI